LLFDVDGGTEDDLILMEDFSLPLVILLLRAIAALSVFDFLDVLDADGDDEVTEYLEIVGAVDVVVADCADR
jgi:hypothetical protein